MPKACKFCLSAALGRPLTTMYHEIWRPVGAWVVRVCVDRAAVFGQRLGSTSRLATRGREIQTTRSNADSSDDVVKNESGGPSAAALNLPWYRLELRRGADGTDLAGRSSRLAGRDGDELDVYGRADYARPRARGRERPHQYRAAASESSLGLAVASELRRSRRSGRNQEKKSNATTLSIFI